MAPYARRAATVALGFACVGALAACEAVISLGSLVYAADGGTADVAVDVSQGSSGSTRASHGSSGSGSSSSASVSSSASASSSGADAGASSSSSSDAGSGSGKDAASPDGTVEHDAGHDATSVDAGPGVGVLGSACSSPGALACNGHESKLTLICNGTGDGTWSSNGTCMSGQLCETDVGLNQGTCQAIVAACASAAPGEDVCSDGNVVQCGPDLVTTSPVATCSGATAVCLNGGCVACTPAATRACNTYGMQTCSSTGAWDACSCADAPVCTPSAQQCSGADIQLCSACGQWDTAVSCGANGNTGSCSSNVCSCTKLVTSMLSEDSPYTAPVMVSYGMIGGGGGSGGQGIGGGAGGSSALVSGTTVEVAVGGDGASEFEGCCGLVSHAGGNGQEVTGSFTLAAGAELAVYVGGGGGAAWSGGGGGGAGYFGGGGGGCLVGGAGGSTVGGAGGDDASCGGQDGADGAALAGGAGAATVQCAAPGGGTATTGGAPGTSCTNDLTGGGGGGALGGGGGTVGTAGGGPGQNGGDDGTELGGTGASGWTSLSEQGVGAGGMGADMSNPGNTGYAGNAGLAVLTYSSPVGVCAL